MKTPVTATLIGLLACLLPTAAFGADPATAPALPQAVIAAQSAADKAMEDAKAKYNAAVIDAKKTQRQTLDTLLKAAMQTGDLDQANTIDATRKKLDAEIASLTAPNVPPVPLVAAWAVGQWDLGVRGGAPLIFTLTADHKATKSNAPGEGKWEAVNADAVRITFADGWVNVLQRQPNGTARKTVYRPGSNVAEATIETIAKREPSKDAPKAP